MASVLTLSASALSGVGTSLQQRADGPFIGAAIPQIGQITGTAGTFSTLTLNVANLLTYPVINIVPATTNAANIVALPAPTTCAGVKCRFVRTGPVLGGQSTLISAGAINLMAGGVTLLASAIGIPPGSQNVSFTATAVPGDWIEFTSNGATWSVSGAAAGIATA